MVERSKGAPWKTLLWRKVHFQQMHHIGRCLRAVGWFFQGFNVNTIQKLPRKPPTTWRNTQLGPDVPRPAHNTLGNPDMPHVIFRAETRNRHSLMHLQACTYPPEANAGLLAAPGCPSQPTKHPLKPWQSNNQAYEQSTMFTPGQIPASYYHAHSTCARQCQARELQS